jgi:hypothetical protein
MAMWTRAKDPEAMEPVSQTAEVHLKRGIYFGGLFPITLAHSGRHESILP